MAVYERGYRSYDGTFSGSPPAWVIFREGFAHGFRSKGYKRLLIFMTLILLAWSGVIYTQMIVDDKLAETGVGFSLEQLFELDSHMLNFHRLSMFLVTIGAVLVGSGLVADDLRTRGLSLYLVRPMRPVDYMLGKAMILPALLLPLALVPGLVIWLMVGLWQPPGETITWLGDHIDIAGRVVGYYLMAAAQMTGLMLLLSSRTPRRGLVIGLSASILLGGPVVMWIGRMILGPIGTLLKSLNIMGNMTWHFTAVDMQNRMDSERGRWMSERFKERWATWQPNDTITLLVCVGLLAAGLYFTWRRARSVEVDA